jgi:carbon-monoxide dehydrogenase large subunit
MTDQATAPFQGKTACQLYVDGEPCVSLLRGTATLADALQAMGVPVHTGCRAGWCGLCLVQVEGRPLRSCLTPLSRCAGVTVRTVRGLGGPRVESARRWLSACGGLQCGYCSPAFLHLIDQSCDPAVPAEDLLRSLDEAMCRCTGYGPIARAAEHVRRRRPGPPGWQRREDERLLTGVGRFVSAAVPPGALHAHVVRSQWSHAQLVEVDSTQAAAVPDVLAVLTAADLPTGAARLHESTPYGPEEPVLARGEVRYVGQPVALVIARSAEAAVAGGARLRVTYRPRPDEPPAGEVCPPDDDPRWLPPLGQSVQPAEDQAGMLLAAGDGDLVTVRRTVRIPRQTAMPMETRACSARWDGLRLTVRGVTKQPRAHIEAIARAAGVPLSAVALERDDIGGSFGVKGELYPEDLLIPLAAVRMGGEVWWSENRAEHMTSTNHSRAQTWHVALTATRDGRLHSANVEIIADSGAYVRPLTSLVPYLGSAMFPGPYRLPRYEARVRCLLTTRTPIGTVRGPGRFESNAVRELALDALAAELGLHPDEFRRRNLLTQAQMPYDVGTTNEGPVHYDTGDPRFAFEAVLAAPARTAPVGDDGLLRGRAVVPFIDKAGLPGTETAHVEMGEDGTVTVEVASAPSGQGHETAFAAVAADELGVDAADVLVVFATGAPGAAAEGLGTFASRAAVFTGNAVALACRRLREEAGRGQGSGGSAPRQLGASATYDAQAHTYPYGAAVCSVAIDPDLYTVTVEELGITCDVGRPLSEAVVRGQLAGGLVQGVSAVLHEELGYGDDGIPGAQGLEDYPILLAGDVPDTWVRLLPAAPPTSASAQNPLGARGAGEAGIAAASGAVVCAVLRALPAALPALDRLPLTPSVLYAADTTEVGPAGRAGLMRSDSA